MDGRVRELLHHSCTSSDLESSKRGGRLRPLEDALIIVSGYSALNECDVYTQFLQNLILPHADDPISCDKMETLILNVLKRSR